MLATGGMLDWRVAGAIVTSLLLYAAGLLLNDYFDRHVDARERPERPIPSGAVSALTVLVTGAVLLVAGVLAARVIGGESAGWSAALVAACVLGYNAALKQRGVMGPAVMGACRAGSVFIGAAFGGGLDSLVKGFGEWLSHTAPDRGLTGATAALVAGGTAWLYTSAVTSLARSEVGGRRPGRGAYLPGLIVLAGGIAMLKCSMGNIKWPLMTCLCWDGVDGGGTIWWVDWAGVAAVALLALTVAEAEFIAVRARRGHLPTPAFIGQLIRAMITVQAAWCAWTCGPLLGRGLSGPWSALLVVVLTWLVVRWGAGFASRRFYGS
ncbi:MAG TPA: UbiA family prenyltransferase [Planctomycetota bacterium]|nr:UbiA family prenyltransferase [Planctomycetota bacterium]